MVLTLNLISLVSHKALVPFEFDVHLREVLRKAVTREKKITKERKKMVKWEEKNSSCASHSLQHDES